MQATPIQEVLLSVDGNEAPLKEFIQSNVIDEPQITNKELCIVCSLSVGEWCNVGMVTVKRVA